jgi:dCMP deaminase
VNSSKWIDYFVKVAYETSELSYAKRMKVGAVVVKEKRIILCGFNGTASGTNNACEDYYGRTLSTVFHAEENLILFAAKKGIALEGAEIVQTHSPCSICSRLILGSGISKLYYVEEYRDLSGVNFLKENGIEVTKINYHHYHS